MQNRNLLRVRKNMTLKPDMLRSEWSRIRDVSRRERFTDLSKQFGLQTVDLELNGHMVVTIWLVGVGWSFVLFVERFEVGSIMLIVLLIELRDHKLSILGTGIWWSDFVNMMSLLRNKKIAFEFLWEFFIFLFWLL